MLKNSSKKLNYVRNDKIEKKKNIKGVIDYLNSGRLVGWVADIEDPAPIDIAVYSNGVLLGQGTADIFRDDLLKCNIHQGVHGFDVELDQDQIIEGGVIEVKTTQNSELIASWQIPTLDQFFKVYLDNVVGNRLDFTVESDKIIGKKVLVFSAEMNIFEEKEIDVDDTYCESHIYIPAKLLDNQKHLIEVGMKDYSRKLGAHSFVLKPILTPWEYLKESYRSPEFLSLPNQADRRYESLSYHLEAISNEQGIISIKDLYTVHSIVVESYEDRKKFPKFSLPKFENPIVSIIDAPMSSDYGSIG